MKVLLNSYPNKNPSFASEINRLITDYLEKSKDPSYIYESQINSKTDISEALLLFEIIFISKSARVETHDTSTTLLTVDNQNITIGESFITLTSSMQVIKNLLNTCSKDSQILKILNDPENIDNEALKKEIENIKEKMLNNVLIKIKKKHKMYFYQMLRPS